MNKDKVITQDSFNRLLDWLDPERERAGEKYETIRRRLIKLFTCRGCPDAEDLADETINRVTLRIHDLAVRYNGEPTLYFYGVANKVHHEYVRRKPPPPPVPPSDDADEIEREYQCLERCMQQLTADQRALVLEYYRDDKRAKIDHRKELAERLGIALNALRIRAHRIRLLLQQCVQACLEQTATG